MIRIRTTGEDPVVFCCYLSSKIVEMLPDCDRIFVPIFL